MKKTVIAFGGFTRAIYGGPYKKKPEMMIGVKMAEEIPLPCHIDIPTPDFSVPDLEDVHSGVQKLFPYLVAGKPIYVGCMGGIGRTGLMMAILVKIYMPWVDPIAYVRLTYSEHAVETTGQKNFIHHLGTSVFPKITLKHRVLALLYDIVNLIPNTKKYKSFLINLFDKINY